MTENLTVVEINQQIAEVERQKAELLAALAEKKEGAKAELISGIKQSIADHGFSLDDIIPLLQPAKKTRKAKGEASDTARIYSIYRHPQDSSKTYVRGVLPGWMKEEMAARGLDPANKGHREQFKAEVLVKEAA